MPPATTCYDHTGRRWELANELASGGEGAVYTVAEDASLIAKRYHKPPESDTVAKLQAMLRMVSESLSRFAAWPQATLHESSGGRLVGFLMSRFPDARPIQNLYSPAQRKKWFPAADWEFLLAVAIRWTSAVAAVHATGCIIGDINPGNILISPRGEVSLIDCDSFQIETLSRRFLCTVGVPLYTPPEMQDTAYGTVARTKNHDHFGLAVMIFQLLFMGRHPYDGIPEEDVDVPSSQRIREFRFAFSQRANGLAIQPPPNVPLLDFVGPEVSDLFERSFLKGSERSNARPSTEHWKAALERLRRNIKTCQQDSGHKFPGHLQSCPWCSISREKGADYFEGVAAVGATFAFDTPRFKALEQRFAARTDYQFEHELPAMPVNSAIEPEPLPESVRTAMRLSQIVKALEQRFAARTDYQFEHELPAMPVNSAIEPEPLPESVRTAMRLSQIVGGVALLSIPLLVGGCFAPVVLLVGAIVGLVFGGWWLALRFFSPIARERHRRQQECDLLRRELTRSSDEIETQLEEVRKKYQRLRREAKALFGRWESLPEDYEKRCLYLEESREQLARDRFLRGQFLSDHTIPQMGDARKQTLASFGIETAFDINKARILRIKGFGRSLTEKLLAWRENRLALFRFDPTVGVPREEYEQIAFEFKHQQESLRFQVESDIHQLEIGLDRLDQDLRPLRRELRRFLDQLSQAEANLALLTGSADRPRR